MGSESAELSHCPMCGAVPEPADAECRHCGERLPRQQPARGDHAEVPVQAVQRTAAIVLVTISIASIAAATAGQFLLAFALAVVFGVSGVWLLIAIDHRPRQHPNSASSTTEPREQ